ncbi:MAG: NAD(P)-dependent oxidoreductase [Sedimentisphaerales bacterium]
MIVVIGASSSIGMYLVDKLIAQRREVFATTRRNINEGYYARDGVSYAKVDITAKSDLERLPKDNIEAVILLAGLLPANLEQYDPKYYELYADINFKGTLNVLEYCRKNKAKKIIFASSHSDVAGLWGCGRAITEDDPRTLVYTSDHTVYIITKIAAMDLVEHYHQEYGIQGVSFRLPAVYSYGPRIGIYVDGKFVVAGFNVFIERAMAGKPIDIWGNPQKGKDMVYVKDVVSAFIKAVDSNKAHGLYNIATGIRTSLQEEVEGIIEVFSPPGHPSKITYSPDKPDGLTYLYDISKAKRDLGYVVRYPYKKMLEDYKMEMNNKRFEDLFECKEQ